MKILYKVLTLVGHSAMHLDAGHRSKTMEDKWICESAQVAKIASISFQSRTTDALIHNYWSR